MENLPDLATRNQSDEIIILKKTELYLPCVIIERCVESVRGPDISHKPPIRWIEIEVDVIDIIIGPSDW